MNIKLFLLSLFIFLNTLFCVLVLDNHWGEGHPRYFPFFSWSHYSYDITLEDCVEFEKESLHE